MRGQGHPPFCFWIQCKNLLIVLSHAVIALMQMRNVRGGGLKRELAVSMFSLEVRRIEADAERRPGRGNSE